MDKENNSIQSFFFQEHEVRFVGTADCPEWIAQDVCAVLGIKNHRDTVAGLEDYQKGVVITDTPGGRQEMLTLKEPGLYEVVMKSRKAQAKEFKRWVFEEVLPSIRKTGSYSAQPKTTAEIILAQAQMLVEVERRLADLEQRQKAIEEEQEIQKMEVDANSAELERFRHGHGYWYSILGWCKLKGKDKLSLRELQSLGRKVSAMCKAENIKPERIRDPRFGEVNLYPQRLLEELVL